MKTETLLMELETLCEKGGYTIRKEKGAFRGDQCIIEGDKLIVINKNKPPESQTAILARVLKNMDPDDTYIKPAVRKELEKIWERLDRFNEKDITEEIQE